MDRSRKARQLEKKILKIECTHPTLKLEEGQTIATASDDSIKKLKKSRKRKIDQYRKEYNSLKKDLDNSFHNIGDTEAHSAVQELINSASVSGSLARKVKDWAKSLKNHDLQLIMLGLPKDPWRKLADIVHFHPDDFSDPNFLLDIHRDSSSSNDGFTRSSHSFVGRMRKLEELSEDHGIELTQQFLDIATKYPHIYYCYAYIRTKSFLMTNEDIVTSLAAKIPLDTALWYFEELHRVSKDCQAILGERLSEFGCNDDEILNSSTKLTFGKLVERILTFQKMKLTFAESLIPYAKNRLNTLKERWSGDCNARFAVFGDASSSMQTAIEASTVFATMVSVCFNAELSFFASDLVKSPHQNPKTLEETFEVCEKIRASGCTSLAAALWPYYSEKKVMDTFVLVTDEVENTSSNGYRFAQLLAEYKKHVNEDVKLIVVRVGKGYVPFQKSLESHGIQFKVVMIDSSRPDLAKFDGLLGQLFMMTAKKVDDQDSGSDSLTDIVYLDSTEAPSDDFVVV